MACEATTTTSRVQIPGRSIFMEVFMIIAGKEYSAIAISGKDNEVLAVVSDTEIVEKDGVHVIIAEKE